MAQFFSYAGAVWWSLAVALLSATIVCGLVQPLIQRRQATRIDQPPVSAIVPVKLPNPGFELAQASLFTQDYPNYEVLIGAAEKASPALEAVRRIAASHPEISSRFLHSAAKVAVSKKLNYLRKPPS